MLTIYKYPVSSEKYISLDMPAGAKILSVQEQDEETQIWALVNPENQTATRDFATFETGALISEEESRLHFIGTYQDLKAEPTNGLSFI